MAKVTYRYTGVLAKPAKRPLLIASTKDPSNRELASRARAEELDAFLERYLALCDDCGVDPNASDAGFKIAFALMERHVPGCRQSKRGRRKYELKSLTLDWEVLSGMVSPIIDKDLSGLSAANNLWKKKLTLKSKFAVDSRYRKVLRLLKNDPAYRYQLEMVGDLALASLGATSEQLDDAERETTKRLPRIRQKFERN